MEPRDRERFVRCLAAASAIYDKEVTKPLADIWWVALARFDIAAVELAFQRHLTNPDVGQFMPKPADVIRMLAGTSIDNAQTAWTKVDRAVRVVGPYASVAFDDALIHRVVTEMGGWIQFGTKTEHDWPFVANEFRTRYAGYKARGEVPGYSPHLPGICEAENRRNGHPVAPPVLLGEPTLVAEVIRRGSDTPLLPVNRMPAETKVALLADAMKGGLKLIKGTDDGQ